MPSIIARGRIAWILSFILGIGLLIGGIVSGQTVLIVGGAAFALFGLVFLILSLVTKGRTD